MTDDASNEPLPEELKEAVRAEVRRLMQARSFAAGLGHLAGRRARMQATCANLLLWARTSDFAAVMNRIRPRQYLKREMPVEVALDIQVAAWLSASAEELDEHVDELADVIEAMQGWTPHKLDAADYFDSLLTVEAGDYAHKLPSAEHHNDHTIRKAQQARQWLGQAKKRGRPAKRKS